MNDFLKRCFSIKSEPAQTASRQDSARPEAKTNPDDVDEKRASHIAVIYRSELDYISRCVLDYPDIETGGDLFGFWTNEGIPVVLYAIGPGRNANHQNAFFVQDLNYFVKIAGTVADRYQLSHMGEWHSHHQLGLARPSGHDANTIFNGLRDVPLRRMLLCIANYRQGRTTVNPYMFHESDMRHFTDASWRVLPLQSPFRPLIDNDLKDILIHPRSSSPCHGEMRILGAAPSGNSGNEAARLGEGHWMRRVGGVDLLKRIIRVVGAAAPGETVSPKWDEYGNIFLTFGGRAVRLNEAFPQDPPVMMSEGSPNDSQAPWDYCPACSGEDNNALILEAFEKWISLSLNGGPAGNGTTEVSQATGTPATGTPTTGSPAENSPTGDIPGGNCATDNNTEYNNNSTEEGYDDSIEVQG